MDSSYMWYNQNSHDFLSNGYLLANQTVDERITIIGNTVEDRLKKKGYAKKFKDYMKKGWISLSTPVWTNFGTDRGLPISCYGSFIADTMESISATWSEVCMMTKNGGGTSIYCGPIRPRGSEIKDNGTSYGSVHFMQAFDMLINLISQGKTRRGNCAVYQDIDHKDIEEFLCIRNEGNPIQDLSYGICVPDYWLKQMIDGDQQKRAIWAKVLEKRVNSGYPYIFFTDTANRNTIDVYKDKKLKIHASNLCSEISLSSSEDESFVCCLSSVNLLYYHEWRNTDLVEVMIQLLDAVMSEFIEKASKIKFMERAVNFATRQRALGLGTLGWHSLLQRLLLPIESIAAKALNKLIHRDVKEKALQASYKLAYEFGEPELLKGYGRRNTTLLAIAPTKSSSFILGQVSEGIEPIRSNYYIKDLQKLKVTVKNPCLEQILNNRNKNNESIWDSINKNSGSVQHLEFLSEDEKKVFKTFLEISPMEIITQATDRQKYICQSQSLNLIFNPNTPIKYINSCLLSGWEKGVKSYYYQFNLNAAQEFLKEINTCSSCEG